MGTGVGGSTGAHRQSWQPPATFWGQETAWWKRPLTLEQLEEGHSGSAQPLACTSNAIVRASCALRSVLSSSVIRVRVSSIFRACACDSNVKEELGFKATQTLGPASRDPERHGRTVLQQSEEACKDIMGPLLKYGARLVRVKSLTGVLIRLR